MKNNYLIIRYFIGALLLLWSITGSTQSDDCPAAEPLEVFEDCRAIPSSTFRLNSFSTENSCNGNTDDDGWFRFVAISPRTQIIVFSDQLANMAISVFEDCKTEIACVNERNLGGQEFLIFDSVIGEEYFVQVYHFDEGGGGFLICLTTEEEVFPSDCAGAMVLCESGLVGFDPIGAGNDDFELIGNDRGCLAKKENNSAWYYFEISEAAPRNSILTFSITPQNNTDFDFALFGPNPVCEALSSPIRCSYAAANCTFCPTTGLGMGATDASESADGDGFVAPLIVQPGEGFFLMVDNASSNETGFDLEWGGEAAAFLNCTTSLPCEFSVDAGNTQLVCEETTVTLNPQTIGNIEGIKYQWRGTMDAISYLNSSIITNPTVTLPTDFSGELAYELTAFVGECIVKDSVFIRKNCVDENACPPLVANLNLTLVNCKDDNSGSIQIGAISGGEPPYLYRLEGTDFQANSFFTELPIGTYLLMIQDQKGCVADTIVELTTTTLPTLEIGSNISIEQGTIVDLQAISNFTDKEILQVTWSNISPSDCPPPCISVSFPALASGTIQAVLETIDGCQVTDEINLTVQPKVDVYIPTSFSPNGDGINDYFSIFAGPGIAKINWLQIFDKWGNLVFEQTNFLPNDPILGWNGTWNNQQSATGAYLYSVELEVIDNAPIKKAGNIFLIR